MLSYMIVIVFPFLQCFNTIGRATGRVEKYVTAIPKHSPLWTLPNLYYERRSGLELRVLVVVIINISKAEISHFVTPRTF